ncbi:menaquinone-dependent protoporphyrinogen oxidase [Clostridium cavendishii DSM 21758]|uniref:Menaquinone-dependent protoporphyrinogen oxidase n=1 Tax=Clostridium cavendishii DSM 21758 TaxID=1121302 RepID=A0A1M6F781_9CLOT|nr:flavodoxin domain-containing protein [Clostridium cavendishii]SHI93522.1 menaquinone-dependent protoporphyrinogen oxidase [Clostridium cavendishii DSM 21758]
MKTLIIYGTKHGTTEKCSKFLKDKITGEVVAINIKNEKIPEIAHFDNIIIGSSIYMGQIQKEIKNFYIKNFNKLKEKRIGLFICAMNEKDIELQLNNAFGSELANRAIVKKCFGGAFSFKNMKFFEKFIVKKIAKTDKDIENISEESINEFAKIINNK